MSQTVHVLGLGSALSSSLFVPQWGRCAGPQGLYPNAMCATQAHGLRPYSQGKNACAGIPHASGTVRACCYSHAVGYIHGVGDHMQLGQSIRQADSSHITEFQEASVSNSRICRYPKEAPPEGVGAIMDRQALGVAWLPTGGESRHWQSACIMA